MRGLRVVVRGGGELASAAGRLLFTRGCEVVVLERAQPLAVRRRVAFAQAVFDGRAQVEGVTGCRVEVEQIDAVLASRQALAVMIDEDGASLAALAPDVLVDGRMAKQPLDTRRGTAPVVIGLGPGLTAGRHVDAVIETQRGPDLGRVYWVGQAQADTSRPTPVCGVGAARVLRAPVAGMFRGGVAIGELVLAGQQVGEVAGVPVRAGTAGRVRGLLADGVAVEAGVKVGDIDPRGDAVDPARLSDKGHAVAAGVLQAILATRRTT